MSKTLIYSMRCGCEFWEGLDYRGQIYPEMHYCPAHERDTQLRAQLAAKDAELKEARKIIIQGLGYLKQIIISDDGHVDGDFVTYTDCGQCEDKRELAQDAQGILSAYLSAHPDNEVQS
jgi:hypothetical protein